jgi:TonB family protein
MKRTVAGSFLMLRLTGAVAISFLLFTSIPLIRTIAGLHGPDAGTRHRPRRIDAEIVRKQIERPRLEARMVQQIKNAPFGGHSYSSTFGGTQFSITPDLSVESQGGVAVAMQNQDLEAMVFEEGQTDENIVPLSNSPIPYPARARELGIEGTLEAILIIDRNGAVTNVDIVRSPHESFIAEAKKVFMTWRFRPAKNKGVPVKVRAKQVIRFTLD